jgi:hypothetical protein
MMVGTFQIWKESSGDGSCDRKVDVNLGNHESVLIGV